MARLGPWAMGRLEGLRRIQERLRGIRPRRPSRGCAGLDTLCRTRRYEAVERQWGAGMVARGTHPMLSSSHVARILKDVSELTRTRSV